MSDERTGRELTPHDEGAQPPAPPPAASLSPERFSAGERAHMVGLTEERSAQVVRQSGNARRIAFLAVLVIAIFIPVYWFYDLGIPALGVQGRMEADKDVQFVTDVERGYALYLANCARCHGPNGQGGVGPPLNDQMKLYNAITPTGGSGKGHLNPDYVRRVLEVGGRYVCGDPNSVMPVWLQPGGPLNYRQVQELVSWITASSDVSFVHDPNANAEARADPEATPYEVHGWRDPNFKPPPSSTPVPSCWRPYSNPAFTSAPAAAGTAAPIDQPGTVDAPRVIKIDLTGSISITDPDGNQLTSIPVKAGETIQFEVTNTAGFDHNFYIGTAEELSNASGSINGGTGIPTFTTGTQNLTVTFPTGGPDLQFACIVPGHYGTMHGDFVIQP